MSLLVTLITANTTTTKLTTTAPLEYPDMRNVWYNQFISMLGTAVMATPTTSMAANGDCPVSFNGVMGRAFFPLYVDYMADQHQECEHH